MEEEDNRPKITQIKDTFSTSWRLVKLVWALDKWLFTITFIATLIPGAVPIINFYIYSLIIDQVVGVVSGKTALDYSYLYILIGARVFTYFLQNAATVTQDYIERLLWSKLPIKLHELILDKTASLDIGYYENPQFRDLLEKVKDSYHFRPQNLLSYILFGFQSILQFLIAFVAIFRFNPYLVIPVVLIALPEFINQNMQSKLSWGVWWSNSPLRKRFWYLSELLQSSSSIKEVKIFELAKRFIDEIKGINQKFYNDNKKIATRNYYFNLGFNLLSTLVFIGVEIYIIFQALIGKVTIGGINFYTGVVANFQQGLGGLIQNLNRLFDNSLYVKSIFDILDKEPHIKEIDKPISLNLKAAPTIEFKNVSFTYPDTNKKILDEFSLKVLPGEKIAFVGENGAGKSTIIKLLARFYDVDSGEILINGVNIKELNLENWYRSFGVLFQDFNRYEHSAKENIHFGRVFEQEDLKRIIKASNESGAHPVITKLEKGYDQILGRTFESGVDLSVGQWQKIALARAFLRSAPVLVLDEPTSSIDAKAESEIFKKVEKLSKDKTVVIISHRFSTVRNADKIYVIDEGKIKEEGSHEELMKLNGMYATLFKLQARGYQ